VHNTAFMVTLVLVLAVIMGACGTSSAPTPTPASSPISTPTPISAPGTLPTPTPGEFEQTSSSHFGFMPAYWDFSNARQAGGAYDRPFFELFEWGMIEAEEGKFNFYQTDSYVEKAQVQGLHIVANIQPFAYWDQIKCHMDLTAPSDRKPHDTKAKPCEMDLYRNFVTRLVERYDGDGIDDMPGLTIPIKHWEVMNEPEFTTGDLIFFQGTAEDYFEILKATYQTVKQADPEAVVVQGGMAGMMEIDTTFWQAVFDLGGAHYFDVANMHSIGHGEHLNIPAFKAFLARNGINDKPIWVTEVQYQQARQTENYTNADFAKILARSYIFALANGVDKLLYVNIKMPPAGKDGGPPFDERSALINDNGEKTALFYAHLTVANMLGKLSSADTVEKIKETVGSWSITEGQYKFTINGKVIYALWGSGSLPSAITGKARVTEISGAQREVDASTLRLSDSPIFVEIVE